MRWLAKIRAEVTIEDITLDQYTVIKQWLEDNNIKYKDRYGDCHGENWGYKAWIDIKNKENKGHGHTFQFYRKVDAVFFKTIWG